jgi:hypothetical protein
VRKAFLVLACLSAAAVLVVYVTLGESASTTPAAAHAPETVARPEAAASAAFASLPSSPAAPAPLNAPRTDAATAVPASPPPPPPPPPLRIAGRSYAEIRADLVERSRARALEQGRLAELEERERRAAAKRERGDAKLEARLAKVRAGVEQAEARTAAIRAGAQPLLQPGVLAAMPPERSGSVVQQQPGAVDAAHPTGGR